MFCKKAEFYKSFLIYQQRKGKDAQVKEKLQSIFSSQLPSLLASEEFDGTYPPFDFIFS